MGGSTRRVQANHEQKVRSQNLLASLEYHENSKQETTERPDRQEQRSSSTNTSSIEFLDIQAEQQRRTAMADSPSASQAMMLSAETHRYLLQPTLNINPFFTHQDRLSSLYERALQTDMLRGQSFAPFVLSSNESQHSSSFITSNVLSSLDATSAISDSMLSRLPAGSNRAMNNAASSLLPRMEASNLALSLEEVRRMQELNAAATLSGPHLYADYTTPSQLFLQSSLTTGNPQSTSFSESMSPQNRLYTEAALGLLPPSNEDRTLSASGPRLSNLPTFQQQEFQPSHQYQSTNLPVSRTETDRLLEQYWLQQQARKHDRGR
jgi:hypothetical protein